jgi:histidinol-phosphate aminotransferase
MPDRRVHGGCDATGLAQHDFSTNSNGCGPCPQAIKVIEGTDASHYPDPEYRSLRSALAEFHSVDEDRIALAGSASEFVFRITAFCKRHIADIGREATVSMPTNCYGDYGAAARAWGLTASTTRAMADLVWACEPSSPAGLADDSLSSQITELNGNQILVLDGAYRPLRLDGATSVSTAQLDKVWQLWSPNKALGVTGVRAAYAISPRGAEEIVTQLQDLAPSWLIGAHGCSMLMAWVQPLVQEWILQSHSLLRRWKRRQIEICDSIGWEVSSSVANFYLARLGERDIESGLQQLRSRGVKLRDARSFGLPGMVRMGVLPPVSQDALWRAWSDRGV